MNTLIKNHKPVDKSNKRVQKRKDDSNILNLFREEDEHFLENSKKD